MKTIKTEEAKLREEIEKAKETQEVFRKQPNVRGGMTDNPNVEDTKKWKEWYKNHYAKVRKQSLNSDIPEAKLFQLLVDKKMFKDVVEKLIGCSGWEELPAKIWDNDIDNAELIFNAYNQGTKEMEKVWHNKLNELLKTLGLGEMK